MEISYGDLVDIRCDVCQVWLSEVITNPMPTHPAHLGSAMARAGWLNMKGTVYCWECKKNVHK